MKYPLTIQVWDRENVNYSNLVNKIICDLETISSNKLKILVPGIGKGRVIRDLLSHCVRLNKSIELVAIEPDDQVLIEFKSWLEQNRYQFNNVNNNIEFIFIKNDYNTQIKVSIFKGSIEDYLTKVNTSIKFDLILCLLVFHYLSYCWLSILRRLYELLNPWGLFIVDKICGKDEQTQLLLECIDSHADKLQSFEIDENCLRWRTFYLNRILQKGAYWGSVIKGTNIKLIIEALEPLFEKHDTLKLEGGTFKLGEHHLPWWWGSDQSGQEDAPPESGDLSLTFEFHIFKNKKLTMPESYWNLLKQACIQTSVQNMNAILWFLKKIKILSFQDTEHFIQDILPSIIMQLAVSSGIINYRCRITSIFIASGSLSPELQLPKLQKLFILINNTDDKGENRIQAWLKNYIIYSDILKHPLSEDFIASGKKFVLFPKENICSEALFKKFKYNPITIPISMDFKEPEVNFEQPTIKQLLWWKLLEIDRSKGVKITEKEKKCLENFISQMQSNVANQQNMDLSIIGLNISYKNLIPLSILMKYLGSILFIPIPTYFEYSESGNLTVHSILGLGITVESDSLDYELLMNIEDIYTFMVILLRRFQDNYLALRWVRAAWISALGSAIAAIMARNMSHNIESHITPRATVEAIRKRLEELDFSESLDIIEVLRGRLDKYRQERADFLAEITSEPLTTTKSISFYRGIILPLIENTLLMDNIARNEGICYRDKTDNRLRIRVFINDSELTAEFKCATGKDSKSYVYPPNSSNSQSGFPYSGHCFDCQYQSGTEDHGQKAGVLFGVLTQGNDIEIEVPGPVGEHAFYSFLENFIRNAAKHNRQHFAENQKENLEINIRISEPEDPNERREFYQIEIWDNVTDPNKKINAMFEGKKYETLYDLIKAYIESDVIDETGRRKEQAYGITEMKVCATLLSGSTNFMDMKEFLKVCKEKREATNYSQEGYQVTQEERLIYRFRLMKPKKMCGVFPKCDETLRNSLMNEGIWIFKSVDELKAVIVPGGGEGSDIPRSAASFRFAVFDCSGENGQEIAEGISELLPYLPFRILVLAGQNSNLPVPKAAHLVNKRGSDMPQKADEIMVWLWRHWLSRWGNETKILEIYLDQENNENPTQEWAQYARRFNEMNQEYPFRIRIWSRDKNEPVAGDRDCQGTHIIFDRHGRLIDILMDNWQIIEEPNLGSQHTYIHLDKLSADFVYVFQKPPSSDFWTFPYELIEAGLLRILVIDERVAEKAAIDQELKVNGFLSRWLLSYWAKIYICTHFGVDKEPEPLHEKHKKVDNMDEFLKMRISLTNEYIDYNWRYSYYGEKRSGKSLNVDMVIIHQGVLDHEKDVNPNFDVEGFLAKIREHIPFVLVDSGRGIPSTLSRNVKFLPFSILNDYILGARIAKYRLAQVTMSLTRKGGK